MSEQVYTLSAEEYAKFQKQNAQADKQKRYQQVLNAKVTLQARWARLNGCPITKKHAEFFADLDSEVSKTLTLPEIMSMAVSRKDGVEATAHAVEMVDKKEGTEDPTPDDEDEDKEPSA